MNHALTNYLRTERLPQKLDDIIRDIDLAFDETKQHKMDDIFNEINENLNKTISLYKAIYEFIDSKRNILERYQTCYD